MPEVAQRVRAPLLRLADDRTISLIIGMPPMQATSVLAMPTASRSRFKLVRRCHGSSKSTALALKRDSNAPTREYIMIHLMLAPVKRAEKSGNWMPESMLSGKDTRFFGLNLKS